MNTIKNTSHYDQLIVRAKCFKMIKKKLILVMIIFLSGCTSLASTQIHTDPLGSDNLLAILEEANSAYHEKNWPQAEVQYRKIIKIMVKDEFSYFRLGNTLLRQGRFNEAIGYFQQAITLNADFNEARHNLTTTYIVLAESQMGEIEERSSDNQKKSIQKRRSYLNQAAAIAL